jgi:hypothetical protein
VNLGPDVPVESLRLALTVHRPTLVYLSLTSRRVTPRFFAGFPRLFEAAQERGAALVVGGQGLTPKVQDRLVASAFGTRLAHLRAFAAGMTRKRA